MGRFQIVDLPAAVDSDANNGSWRIGDWADTLELPNIGQQAIVRWIPGPYEITGRSCLGYLRPYLHQHWAQSPMLQSYQRLTYGC